MDVINIDEGKNENFVKTVSKQVNINYIIKANNWWIEFMHKTNVTVWYIYDTNIPSIEISQTCKIAWIKWEKNDDDKCVVEIPTNSLNPDRTLYIWETGYKIYLNSSTTPITLKSEKNYTWKIKFLYHDNDLKIYDEINHTWKIFQKNDFTLSKIEIKR